MTPRRVLLVEDCPVQRLALAGLLADAGAVAVEAGSIAEAEAFLAAGGLDGIVADRRLTDGDGHAWAKSVAGRLPVVLLTAEPTDPADPARLAKPPAVADLQRRLRLGDLSATRQRWERLREDAIAAWRQMPARWAAADRAGRITLAHDLRGAAGMLGFPDLVGPAARLEANPADPAAWADLENRLADL